MRVVKLPYKSIVFSDVSWIYLLEAYRHGPRSILLSEPKPTATPEPKPTPKPKQRAKKSAPKPVDDLIPITKRDDLPPFAKSLVELFWQAYAGGGKAASEILKPTLLYYLEYADEHLQDIWLKVKREKNLPESFLISTKYSDENLIEYHNSLSFGSNLNDERLEESFNIQDYTYDAIHQIESEWRQLNQHKLYNTLFRRDLVDHFAQTGTMPVIPGKSLKDFTHWIMRNCDSDEKRVRAQAEYLEKATIEELEEHIGTRFVYPYAEYEERVSALTGMIHVRGTKQTQKNLRRTLRSIYKQANEQVAHIFKKVRSNGQKYMSHESISTRQDQLYQQFKWVRATTVTTMRPNKKTGELEKFGLPLEKCMRTARMQFSEKYCFIKGQEKVFTNKGYIPIFVTMTTPAQFHPCPTVGQNRWDGSSVTDSHAWFTHRWNKTRAFLHKHGIELEGFRVTEPHQDGAEHWHAMLYAKPCDISIIKNAIRLRFGHSTNAVTFKQDFLNPSQDGKKASAASYMLKYIVKTIRGNAASGTSAANDPLLNFGTIAADAWRSGWSLRGMQFFGIFHGKVGIWRELRRMEVQPTEKSAKRLWRAARGTDAAKFIGAFIEKNPSAYVVNEIVPVIDETFGDVKGYKKGRVIGFNVNKNDYVTHDDKWELETDLNLLKDFEGTLGIKPFDTDSADGMNLNTPVGSALVSIKHRYPRGGTARDGSSSKTPKKGFGMHVYSSKRAGAPPGEVHRMNKDAA